MSRRFLADAGRGAARYTSLVGLLALTFIFVLAAAFNQRPAAAQVVRGKVRGGEWAMGVLPGRWAVGTASSFLPPRTKHEDDDENEPQIPSLRRGIFRRSPTPADPESGTQPGKAPTDPLVIAKNVSLTTAIAGSQRSTVCEPTQATSKDGRVVFYTGNWFAAISADGGNTFTYINPFKFFPATAGGFCCDQVVHYVPQYQMFVWLLQYNTDGAGENIYRIAVANSLQATLNKWKYYDFQTRTGYGYNNHWLDFPDLAVGANMLDFTANVFDNSSPAQWYRTLITRIPLADLAAQGNISWYFLGQSSVFTFRLAQGCGTRQDLGQPRQPQRLPRILLGREPAPGRHRLQRRRDRKLGRRSEQLAVFRRLPARYELARQGRRARPRRHEGGRRAVVRLVRRQGRALQPSPALHRDGPHPRERLHAALTTDRLEQQHHLPVPRPWPPTPTGKWRWSTPSGTASIPTTPSASRPAAGSSATW